MVSKSAGDEVSSLCNPLAKAGSLRKKQWLQSVGGKVPPLSLRERSCSSQLLASYVLEKMDSIVLQYSCNDEIMEF